MAPRDRLGTNERNTVTTVYDELEEAEEAMIDRELDIEIARDRLSEATERYTSALFAVRRFETTARDDL